VTLDPIAGNEAPRDPEELEASGGDLRADIAAETGMGPVHLTVASLARSLDYYRTAIGLEVLSGDESAPSAALGCGGRELLVLDEVPNAAPSDGYTGLFHFALLLPERHDLAGWLAHAARDRVPMTGMSDHFVSEALYLRDPDGHGIEIYWDRPREVWQGQVDVRMTTERLDVQSVLGELDNPETEPFSGLPDGTIMGHVHLKVADIASTVGFYRDVLGFGLMAQLGNQAAFLAAGGYHHHLGANTWESAGADPPPQGSAALQKATIVLPDAPAREHVLGQIDQAGHAVEDDGGDPVVRDPSGNRIALLVR
jgi:catechol 2,3-dioxygenase